MTATDYEALKQARDFAAKQLQATHPHLIPCNGNSLVVAAKNIRIELARAFPGVKFAVRSERFSGGDAIRVNWTDGPTTKQVDEIVNAYESGSFDGSTDCYNYRGDHGWTDAFGDAKYITTNRHQSEAAILSACRRVKSQLGGISESIEEMAAAYKTGSLWKVKQSGGCDVSREVNIAISKQTYSIRKM